MDLLHSKVSLAFVSGSWIPQDPLQPSALTPPCATPWVLLFFAPFSCWALPCWHDSHLLCHCGFARPSRACCPNLSPLIGPGLSSLLRSCRSGPLLMRTLVLPASLSPLALAYVSLHEAAQPCCSLASVCCFFCFCWGLFIYNYYSADSFPTEAKRSIYGDWVPLIPNSAV